MFVEVRSYDNYIDAHLMLGRLRDEFINCHLLNENSVTLDPFLSNAIGGIKLMVAESQVERALELIKETEKRNTGKSNRFNPFFIPLIVVFFVTCNMIHSHVG